MDWLFDNLQLLLVIGGAVAYWLNQRRKTEEEDETRPQPPALESETSAEDEVRRIQEEIRRKIAQRTGQGTPEWQQPQPPVLQPQEIPRSFADAAPQPPALPHRRVAVYDDSEEIARQQRLAAELKRLEDRRRETRELAQRVRQDDATARAFPSATASSRAALPHEFLRDPDALKRAVIMREVLGPPVSLR